MNAPTTAVGEWKRYWTLPLAAAVGYSTAVLHTYAFGPFIAPLQEEFSWSRAQISFGFTIVGIAGAALAVPIGVLVDRLGPRLVGLIGVVLMASAWALLGTATGDEDNWLLLWCYLAFANVWLQATVWTSAIASRFEKSRGLAFGITLSGASFAALVFPLLATTLIANYGWRTGFVAMGGFWAALVLPVMLVFFRSARDATRHAGATPQPSKHEIAGLSIVEGLQSLAFWKLFLASGLFAFATLGIVVHLVPLLTENGTELLAAAGAASLVGFFSIIGRLGTGVLLDRLPGRVIGAAVSVLPIIAAALLLLDGSNPASQSAAAAFIGITVGAGVNVIAYLVTRYLGLKNFGLLFGAMVGALSVGTALGPLAAGATYDAFGGYSAFLMVTMVLMMICALALATLGEPMIQISPSSSPAGGVIMLVVGVLGVALTWYFRPPSDFGEAVMRMGQGHDFYLREPVFLALLVIFGLLALFGLVDAIRSRPDQQK